MSVTARLDAVTNLTPEYLNEVVPPPRSVKIELTGRCNFKCSFCAHNQRLREVNEMPRDLFQKVVTELHNFGVKELGVFYLGESFLCQWLPEAIKFAKDTGFEYVFLTNNGSLSTPDRVEACMAAGLDSLKFSLNYADEKQFKKIAQVKGSLFHNIAENVKGARRVRDAGGYKCHLAGSYIKYDPKQMKRMKPYITEMRKHLDEVYPLPLYNQAALVNNGADESWEFIRGNRSWVGGLRDPLPCWSIFTEGHVAFDGVVSACCFDHDHRFAMGNLNDEMFADVWNNEKFRALRAAHLKKDICGTVCEGCV